MIRIDPNAIDFAKSGLFAALGSATDEHGNKLKIEVADEQLRAAAELALDHLAASVFGPDVYLKKDAA